MDDPPVTSSPDWPVQAPQAAPRRRGVVTLVVAAFLIALSMIVGALGLMVSSNLYLIYVSVALSTLASPVFVVGIVLLVVDRRT